MNLLLLYNLYNLYNLTNQIWEFTNICFFCLRIYINFVDMDASNVAWNNSTFG